MMKSLVRGAALRPPCGHGMAVQRCFAAVLSLLLLFVFVLVPYTAKKASAAELSPQESFEQTSVLDDLKGSTIGGKPFDINDYPHNGQGSPQIIAFAEFCYSYYEEKQNDYSFYVYVYNPQDVAFDTATERNKIQFSSGKDSGYHKYPLEFVKYSDDAGYEGRFFKFKVKLTDAERGAIWKSVEENRREYRISGIELSVGGVVEEYGCKQVYTYSGFALGYGSPLAKDDTLTCTVDGLEICLTLDVRSTYYRPKGTNGEGYTQDTLHSVYFSVPNAIIEEYGEMTAVHATWLNAYTAPMLVTGNKEVYDAILPYLGQYVGGGTQEDYANTQFPYALIATKAVDGFRDDDELAPFGGYYAYNAYYNYGKAEGEDYAYDKRINYLQYLFYAGEGTDSADNYMLPAETIIGDKQNDIPGWLETYTNKFGGALVNNRYSAALFESVGEKFEDKTITGDEEYTLSDLTLSSNPWRWWIGQDITQVESEKYSTVKAIQKVTVDDFNLYSEKSSFCETFFVDQSDYDAFRSYVKDAAGREETTYLFRYYLSEYVSNEVTEYERTTDWALFGGNFGAYKTIDTNAYFAQMWIQLDFDIIDLTFTKNNVDTVIPVIASPQDMAADVAPPAHTQSDKKSLTWWQIVLAVILVVLLIILLWKFLPWILQAIVWVILLPFKLIAALCKAISNSVKKRRRKKEEEQQAQQNEQAEKPPKA